MATQWQKNILQASFRGIIFDYENQEIRGGRRLENHEYTYQDVNYVEDLGRRARYFKIEAYVIGADYIQRSSDLIRALDAYGPGKFVHPLYGELNVCVEDYTSHNDTSGLITHFSIIFIESGIKQFPNRTVNTQSNVIAKTNNLINAGTTSLYGTLSTAVSGFDYVYNTVVSTVKSYYKLVNGIASYINNVAAFISNVANMITNAKNNPLGLGSIFQSVNNLLSSVDKLGRAIGDDNYTRSSFNAGLTLFNAYTPVSPKKVGVGVLGSVGSNGKPTGIVTPSRQNQANVTNAINHYNAQHGVALMAQATTVYNYASYSDVIADRNTITASIDSLLLDANTSSNEFTALRALRSSVVDDLNTRAAQKPQIKTYSLGASLPSYLVAHIIYGDATQRDSLINRNEANITNSLFMPKDIDALISDN